MKRIALLFFIVLVAMLAGCSSDPARPKPTPSPYHNLSEQGDVLFNLQLAMNKMDAAHYVEVLDPVEFAFFFSPGDVGGDIPQSWGFAEEEQAAQKLLGGDGGTPNNPILSIDLALDLANADWVEFDPSSNPGVFETAVGYSYKMDTENQTTYITSGTETARFRIKQDDGGKWRLVGWEDIGSLRSAPAGTQETNWGKLKALYR